MKKIIYANYSGFQSQEVKFTVGTFTENGFKEKNVSRISSIQDAASYLFSAIQECEYNVVLCINKTGISMGLIDCLVFLLRQENYDLDLLTGEVFKYSPLKEKARKAIVALEDVEKEMLSKPDTIRYNTLEAIDEIKKLLKNI